MDEVVRTAQSARREFEAGIVDEQLLMTLYSKYASIFDVQRFVRKARELFPALNCGLASMYLQYVLRQGEIVKGKYNGQGHTFLSLGKQIVDITADQFGGPTVYIGPLVSPWAMN